MDDEDFPTDEQVRLYTMQFMEKQASEQSGKSTTEPFGFAGNGFIMEFMARNPDIKVMRYLEDGKYEVCFSVDLVGR